MEVAIKVGPYHISWDSLMAVARHADASCSKEPKPATSSERSAQSTPAKRSSGVRVSIIRLCC